MFRKRATVSKRLQRSIDKRKITRENFPFASVEKIASIPAPTRSYSGKRAQNSSIEHVLHRKANDFMLEGRLDLALACLKRSNEIVVEIGGLHQATDYERKHGPLLWQEEE